jgi:hypothetical protein
MGASTAADRRRGPLGRLRQPSTGPSPLAGRARPDRVPSTGTRDLPRHRAPLPWRGGPVRAWGMWVRPRAGSPPPEWRIVRTPRGHGQPATMPAAGRIVGQFRGRWQTQDDVSFWRRHGGRCAPSPPPAANGIPVCRSPDRASLHAPRWSSSRAGWFDLVPEARPSRRARPPEALRAPVPRRAMLRARTRRIRNPEAGPAATLRWASPAWRSMQGPDTSRSGPTHDAKPPD